MITQRISGKGCPRWWGVAALPCLSLFFLIPSHAAEPSRSPQVDDPVHRVMDLGTFGERDTRRVVEAAYGRLQKLSGNELRFEIEEMETIVAARFGGVRWLDIVDMPDGRLIDVTRQSHRDDLLAKRGLDPVTVRYRPQWRTQEKLWSLSPWGKALEGMSVEEVLRQAGQEQSELRSVRAITHFVVVAELSGEVRTYRAAFLWIASNDGDGLSFLVADNIVQGIEDAVREPERIQRRPRFRVGERPDRERGLKSEDASCQEDTQTYQSNHYGSSSSGHLWGEHASTATFFQACECRSNCTQFCSAEVSSSSCTESGFTSEACHKTSSSTAGSTATSSAGDSSPVTCSAGAGCVEKSCLFCLCGLGVGVNANGPSVSFTPSGGADWDGSFPFSHTCAPCSRVPDPPPGGGGGGGCTCDCDNDGWVTLEECYNGCGGWSDGTYCYVGAM